MTTPLQACQPATNAIVSASAGSGKTWLLVTRIIRLLLNGAKPDSILAITFTNKAATEMSERLMSRLYEFAVADDKELNTLIGQIGLEAHSVDYSHARRLYEKLLSDRRGVIISTFHAFSQSILRKFPLEADIAANFELAETTELLRQEAWNKLMDNATAKPDTPVARAIESLMELCNGPYNARAALYNFLEHRSDWWAYSLGHDNPLEHTSDRIAELLDIDPGNPPSLQALISDNILQFEEFIGLIEKHDTKTNMRHAELLRDVVKGSKDLLSLQAVFLTQKGEPLKRKPSKAQQDKMGADGEIRFLQLHDEISATIIEFTDTLARHRAYTLNKNWLTAGITLLDVYQNIKRNQRILDFADLEWQACKLVNESDNAHWIQFKLDQRIDHLLVDEFQDTNPTQWRLLQPLLEELATHNNNDRQRSCFIVGDSKQSIYGFRRADSNLFKEAGSWLSSNLKAITTPLEVSWRSSPAIINFVNQVFSDGQLNEDIQTFTKHDTHQSSLPGKVEVLPLYDDPGIEEEGSTAKSLRNPLLRPRDDNQDARYKYEAKHIADTISNLINECMQVTENGSTRPLQYNDILILLRTRTEARTYEAALREQGIPYFGAERGTLLDRIEIGDMIALLDVLVTPHDNLALARVLRSPLFSLSSEQLVTIAEESGKRNAEWIAALHELSSSENCADPIKHASMLIKQWQSLAGRLPVHDLLDKIYSEANVYERFCAAAPSHLSNSIRANLTRFIELALEIDSGRYPSMMQFRTHLRAMHEFAPDKMNEAVSSGDLDRVRIMTIHASKGLEAPVVFLADSARPAETKDTYTSLVSWPSGNIKPEFILLLPRQNERDSKIRNLQQQQKLRDKHEQANLLYVAITRAKQLLYISASKPRKSRQLGWYGQICAQLDQQDDDKCIENGFVSTYGKLNFKPSASRAGKTYDFDDVSRMLPPAGSGRDNEIAPSRSISASTVENEDSAALIDEHDSIHARNRGIVIHRLMELLSPEKHKQMAGRINLHEFSGLLDEASISLCLDEASKAIEACPYPGWFDPSIPAMNEVPLIYTDDITGKTVYGIIDRLLIKNDEITIIDYKTHRSVNSRSINKFVEQYSAQMRYYVEGVNLLWPGKKVASWLYFTSNQQAIRSYSTD